MKVIVTGGLGYVGAALLDTFREDFDRIPGLEVVVVDKEFVPQRIVTLQGKGLNFRYVQADINTIDENGVIVGDQTWEPILKDADVIFHLASPVEAESSVNREEETWRTIKGATLALARAKTEECLMFFASTANVFGGIPAGERNAGLSETDKVCPIYPYAQSKASAEAEIINNTAIRNVTICRFGTAFGYSDGIRFNLVTNIFFKRMLEGKDLHVYGDGSNLRPLCHVRDIARALRFLAEKRMNNEIGDKEVFHVVQANYAIRDLARVVAGFNPKCSVVHPVDKPAPFMSYALSNAKLTSLGFKFEENLAKSTKEMLYLFRAAGGAK